MLEQRTVIDQIEIDRFGNVNVRFAKEIVNKNVVIAKEWHRTSFPPGSDIDSQIAVVDAHLESMGAKKTDTARITELKAIMEIVTTPERVAEELAEASRAEN